MALVRRQDLWRNQYRANRYMIDASLDTIAQRSRDININMLGVNEFGLITPGKISPASEKWWVLWTHIMDEFNIRGLNLPRDGNLIDFEAMTWASAPNPPRGLRILRGNALPSTPYFARVGQKVHLYEAITRGRFRIAPAASYQDPSLNSAIRDDELTVTAVRSARAAGVGLGGEVSSTFRLNENFYVLCLTHTYDMRLLDDFRGDSLLIIHNQKRFRKRLIQAVKRIRPDLICVESAVNYYDPYFIDPAQGWVPLLKHFRFSYQHEIRFIWTGANVNLSAEPFFVELGPLRDIAKLYTLTR